MTSQEIEELAGHRQVPAWVVKLVGDAIAAEREACASLEVEVVVPTKDYSSMTPLDCYEAALMDQAIAFRAAIRARGQIKPKPETVSPAELRWRANRPWDDKET
jgi:hypothetical protein